MKALNKQALRVLAVALDGDDWHAEGNSVYGGRYDVGDNVCYDHIASCESVNGESPNADFISAANPATVLALLDELEAAENELNACKSILEKIKSTSCHVDTSPGAFIPNSLDAWGRPVPQYLPYDFSGNPGVSATQYCNGWNDAGGYWLNHVKYLQECIRAAGIGVKGE